METKRIVRKHYKSGLTIKREEWLRKGEKVSETWFFWQGREVAWKMTDGVLAWNSKYCTVTRNGRGLHISPKGVAINGKSLEGIPAKEIRHKAKATSETEYMNM